MKRILTVLAALSLSTMVQASKISTDDYKSIRFGKGTKANFNWATSSSNLLNNTYQETIKIIPVCVEGRRFVAVMGMAGVWEEKITAGAGGGAGIIQVFDADDQGRMAAVSCNN